MAKPSARIHFLQGVLAILGVGVLVRSVVLQVVQYPQWHVRAEQRRVTRSIMPRRGTIYDRNGVILASTEPQYRLRITVRELRDTATLVRQLPELLNISPQRVRAEFARDYPFFAGPFTAEEIDPIRNLRGVHLDVVYRRVYPQDSTAVALIGTLDASGTSGVGGIEKSYDSLLSGTPGEERAWRSAAGRVLESPGNVVREPVAGASVYLTIDRDLQNIAETELLATIGKYSADGGDFVIYEVETGEILANASFRRDSLTGRMQRTASAIVEGYDPGSTAKLFTAAAILKTGSDTTPVSGECGAWGQVVSQNYTRHIFDVHRTCEMLGLGDAIKFSSNIAMSKFSLRLNGDEQFMTLRDFGFGTPLGLNFPKETGGLLKRPADWDNPLLAKPSMAQGYYFRVSTTHLAAAYAAIGNHGILLAPALVREIRDSRDSVRYRHRPQVIRRAIPDSVARHLMQYLGEVTETGGTGLKAQLDDSSVVGKTGTAVLNFSKKGEPREYRASFAGLQPADHPRISFTAMIYRPQGQKYGGTVAAPIIRTALQQAIALLASPIDRKEPAQSVVRAARPMAELPVEAPEHSLHLPLAPATMADAGLVAVPELGGRTLRDAAFALHQLGFTVKLVGRGRVRGTVPVAGDSMPRGSMVTLRADSL